MNDQPLRDATMTWAEIMAEVDRLADEVGRQREVAVTMPATAAVEPVEPSNG